MRKQKGKSVKKAILGSFLFVIICSAVPALAAEGFTQKDRDMLIELADRNLIEKNSLLLTKLTEAMRRMADKSPDIREALQQSHLL